MEFGTTIKKIRTNQQLTQEEFGKELHVTRQAVSNWENNRNLPDLEMIILISKTYHLSLDELILGEDQMTHKLIKDGSETRRAQLNLITTLIGSFLLLIGLGCFLIKANSVEYLDATGMLHENFYLIPIGFLFLLAGGIVIFTTGLSYFLKKADKA
ncbi:DUF3955 domain-containing protein [Vagococcus humatus]|uniref:XRE family transcriptional regulator n=1 Tax=Vagococcus humatus TaxID=1889241 RepID=A0A429Z7K5_9ENTE|nr:DUF3955 domain-containing protein [Vagococcus humatus]RST89710.1 XRE family transcriptional regulator [Vagococcus humatus]